MRVTSGTGGDLTGQIQTLAIFNSEAADTLFACARVDTLLTNDCVRVCITPRACAFICGEIADLASVAFRRSTDETTRAILDLASCIDADVFRLVEPEPRAALLADCGIRSTLATFLHVAGAIPLAFFRLVVEVVPVNTSVAAIEDATDDALIAVHFLAHRVITIASFAVEFEINRAIRALAKTTDRWYQSKSIIARVADCGALGCTLLAVLDLTSRIDADVLLLIMPKSVIASLANCRVA